MSTRRGAGERGKSRRRRQRQGQEQQGWSSSSVEAEAESADAGAGVAAEGNADICEVARDGGRVALAEAGPEEARRATAAQEAAAAG
mmetsp:Transcript_13637/g.40034  ORF Transcript_13637/g.40034 Transcript_13637/m.40034 type:complete len:87 (-) Transcript_13637:76-336(-)